MAVVIMVEVLGVVRHHQNSMAAQLKVLLNSPGQKPPVQNFACRYAEPFRIPEARFIHQVLQVHLLLGDLEPLEPTPPALRPLYCTPLVAVVLCHCLVLVLLVQYKHCITRRARRMARRYAMKKLKGKLFRSFNTLLIEFSKELMRSVTLGLGKAMAIEVANVVTNEMRFPAQ